MLFSSADLIDQINGVVQNIQSMVNTGGITIPSMIEGYLSFGKDKLNVTIQKLVEDMELIQKRFSDIEVGMDDNNTILLDCLKSDFPNVYYIYYEASLQPCLGAYQKQLNDLQTAILAKYESYLSDAEVVASQVHSCGSDISCQQSIYTQLMQLQGQINAYMGSKTRLLQSWYNTGSTDVSTCLNATAELILHNVTSFVRVAETCSSITS